MKNLVKAALAGFLALVARAVIRRYRPKIVMVTGSVGKTSTKDAVAAALSARFIVRANAKSFNTEFGVPLTILGVGNPWANPLAWLGVAKAAFALLLLPNHYPNLLVLEVGADKPGDLARILRIAKPDAVVVTRLPDIPVHVEAYASPEAVREEEFSPAHTLAAGTPLIVPADDPHALTLAAETPARLVTYGEAKDATVHLSDIDFDTRDGLVIGMTARVTISGVGEQPLTVEGSVGGIQLLPGAAALATALALDIPLAEASQALQEYIPPAGRGRLFSGVNESMIIDDTYNASPPAVEEALETLRHFPKAKRRVAILGDMLELGRYSVAEHERVGALAATSCDFLVAVGIRARAFIAAAREAGIPDARLLAFDDSHSAAQKIREYIRPGDIVLVKGSQSIRLERVTEVLLRNPSDTVRLVRQEEGWKLR